MLEVRQAQIGLDSIRSKVIGFIQDDTGSNTFEMIISIDDFNDTVDTVRIGGLGAIQESHGMPIRGRHVIHIPEFYGNFLKLLSYPHKWIDFYNDNFKR